MALRIGYKASAEQFDPSTLLDFTVEAERSGFELAGVSDHFQPWRHTGGHSPAALPWLGAAGQRTSSHGARHQRADADAALPPLRRSPRRSRRWAA